MARFTAFASDTSDEEEFLVQRSRAKSPTRLLTQKNLRLATTHNHVDEDDDDEDDEDYSESESSSEMDEDELDSPARRTRRRRDPNALVEGADGEYYHAHEIDEMEEEEQDTDEEDITDSDQDVEDALRNGGSGESQPIPWARQVGVDPQKMHLMQASLFRLPEEESALRVQTATTAKSGKPRLTWANGHGLHRKHSRESDGDFRLSTREVWAPYCILMFATGFSNFCYALAASVFCP